MKNPRIFPGRIKCQRVVSILFSFILVNVTSGMFATACENHECHPEELVYCLFCSPVKIDILLKIENELFYAIFFSIFCLNFFLRYSFMNRHSQVLGLVIQRLLSSSQKAMFSLLTCLFTGIVFMLIGSKRID